MQAERPLNLSRLYVDQPFLGARVGAALMHRCLEEGRARKYELLGNDPQRDLVLALAL